MPADDARRRGGASEDYAINNTWRIGSANCSVRASPSNDRNGVAVNVVIGCDHAGFQFKERIKQWLEAAGHVVRDFGTDSEAPVDYPRFIRPVAEAVARGEFDRGIVLGGSGNGEAIVANRVRGVRCALCWNTESARLSRQHNDANVLSIGERLVPIEAALDIVKVWLDTPFEGGRHARRIRMIDKCP